MTEQFLPRVVVNVNEVVNKNNIASTYVPAFILRAPTGPVGEINFVSTYADFIATYGDPDQFVSEDFPVFYGLGAYLKEYNGIYVTRLASDDASYGTIEGSIILRDQDDTPIEEVGENVKIVSVKTDWKTDIYNGIEVTLRIDNISSVIYAIVTVGGVTYETTRFGVDFGSLTPVQFENILDNIVDSFNSLKTGLTMKREYTSAHDVVPSITDRMYGIITGGNSGSNTVDNMAVKAAINAYDSVEVSIDTMTFPEFENLETIKYAVDVAEKRRFFVLSTACVKETFHNTITAVSDIAAEYNTGDEFTFVVDDITYTGIIEDVNTDPFTISTNYPTNTLESYAGVYETVLKGEGQGNGLQILIESTRVENPTPSVGDIMSLISEYPKSSTLAVYLDKVNYIDGFYIDPLTGEQTYIDIPASVAVQHAFAQAYAEGPYKAPAGVNRGILKNVKKLRHSFTDAEVTRLNNYSIPVNPIVYKATYGYAVWDEKTTAEDASNPYSRYIDGAALINYLVNKLYTMSQKYLFEPITSTTFASWELEAISILNPLVGASAIDSKYVVTMNATNNSSETIARHELHGWVKVRKIDVAREVIIDLEVSNRTEEEE